MPEPLQFRLGDGARLMLIPTGGFGWVLGDRPSAAAGTSECLLNLAVDGDDGVDDLVHRAVASGATLVYEPALQGWGYAGAFADPDGHVWMITSAAIGDDERGEASS